MYKAELKDIIGRLSEVYDESDWGNLEELVNRLDRLSRVVNSEVYSINHNEGVDELLYHLEKETKERDDLKHRGVHKEPEERDDLKHWGLHIGIINFSLEFVRQVFEYVKLSGGIESIDDIAVMFQDEFEVVYRAVDFNSIAFTKFFWECVRSEYGNTEIFSFFGDLLRIWIDKYENQ